MFFVVMAYDYPHSDAEQRRKQSRYQVQAELERVKQSGELISGGDFTDLNGKIIGTNLHMNFPSCDALERWLNQLPVVQNGVWEKIDVCPLLPVVEP